MPVKICRSPGIETEALQWNYRLHHINDIKLIALERYNNDWWWTWLIGKVHCAFPCICSMLYIYRYFWRWFVNYNLILGCFIALLMSSKQYNWTSYQLFGQLYIFFQRPYTWKTFDAWNAWKSIKVYSL